MFFKPKILIKKKPLPNCNISLFRLDFLLAKRISAFDFKTTNLILCHVLCCLLVWKVFETILNDEDSKLPAGPNERTKKKSSYQEDSSKKWWMDTAFLSTLLFAVHPVHVEAVSGVVGRADLLAAITFFPSIP